jgi:predicted AAA+ superfamily ATPase
MKERYLLPYIQKLALKRHKMAFISGPRQIGKTTLSKMIMNNYSQASYLNWDESTFRKLWTKSPNQLETFFNFADKKGSLLLVLDEIHKSKSWKQKLKGIYDHLGEMLSIIVTGSARLNVYRRGGDSLMGRYLHFRLHTFSVAEALKISPRTPEQFFNLAFSHKFQDFKAQVIIEKLMNFSGFPEPFLAGNRQILNIWRQGRIEKVVRQDLLDLTRIQEISHVEALMSLLPEKVGAPVSTASLREDLEVSFDTVKRWLLCLEELYYCYTIKPYSKSIVRSLKKEPKLYLYDWTEIENLGSRFENLVASHLLKACHFWNDTGEGMFDLCYLRDKQKNEVDFVLIKDKKPWFTVECKLSDTSLDVQHKKFQNVLKVPHVQLVHRQGQWRKVDPATWIMSAEYFLPLLV